MRLNQNLNNELDKDFDWIIIGGGISGISLAEILTRQGKSVLLLEKNNLLASETSKIFHEWLHTGALYTLLPDKLLTQRYMIGAIDDLLEYYSGFKSMNLEASISGLKVKNPGWYNNDPIYYKYKRRVFNPLWTSLVSKSISLVDDISNHDWLRKKAGEQYGYKFPNFNYWYKNIPRQLNRKRFTEVISSDLTINSRLLINDILSNAISNGLNWKTSAEVIKIDEHKNYVSVLTKKEKKAITAKNLIIAAPDLLSKFMGYKINTGYAPIHIVDNVPEDMNNFVELDIKKTNCINLLKKESGIGQAGGITISSPNKVQEYSDFIITQHKKINPNIKSIGSYIGIKKELVSAKENRNYLYHIAKHNNRIWSVVLGKFTLFSSMAPEFYRRAYKLNPDKRIDPVQSALPERIVSDASWQEIAKNYRRI